LNSVNSLRFTDVLGHLVGCIIRAQDSPPNQSLEHRWWEWQDIAKRQWILTSWYQATPQKQHILICITVKYHKNNK